MTTAPEGFERLLTPGEVAALFRVDAKTVTRWAKEGRLNARWTLGLRSHGHRRYVEAEVRALLEGQTTDQQPEPQIS